MTSQLPLIDRPAGPWHLDDRTRAVGLQGVARARSALQAARSRAVAAEHTDDVENAEFADVAGTLAATRDLATAADRVAEPAPVPSTSRRTSPGARRAASTARGAKAARRAIADARAAVHHADAA